MAGHKGFIGRELLKSEDGWWVDAVHWETMEDAQSTMKNFLGHPSTKKFEEVIEPSSIKMIHLEVVKKY